MHKRGWILLLVGEMAAAAAGIGAIHQKAPEVARILGLEREAVNDAERRDQKMKSLLSPMNVSSRCFLVWGQTPLIRLFFWMLCNDTTSRHTKKNRELTVLLKNRCGG